MTNALLTGIYSVQYTNSSVHHRVKHLSPKQVSNEYETERVRSRVVNLGIEIISKNIG
jgi:hypothetical protein